MQNIKAYVMLVCASLFWAGNFMIGKYAFFSEIPPLTLVFYRWSLVWIILLPFTYKEIIKYKDTILDNLPLLFFLGLIFSWWILVPAAINFFITFGADIVEPTWSIERYFDFVLL